MHNSIAAALYELERQRKLRTAEDNEIERLTVLAQGIGGAHFGDDAPRGSTSGDRLEIAAINLSEHKTLIKRDRRQRAPLRIAALATLWRELPTGAAFVAAEMYDKGLTVEQIADGLGYSQSWIYMQIERIKRGTT